MSLCLMYSQNTYSQVLKNDWISLSSLDRNELALQHVQTLKNGSLIVVLPYYENKIAHLQNLLEAPQLSPKKKKRVEKLITKTLSERDSSNLNFINNFPKGYTFSEVFFLYNKDFSEFAKFGDAQLLMDYKGDPLNANTPLSKNLYFGHKHRLRAENTAGGYYFVVTTQDLQIIPKPFPSFLPLENTFLTLLTFFDGNNYPVDPMIIGTKVQKKLEKIGDSIMIQNSEK